MMRAALWRNRSVAAAEPVAAVVVWSPFPVMVEAQATADPLRVLLCLSTTKWVVILPPQAIARMRFMPKALVVAAAPAAAPAVLLLRVAAVAAAAMVVRSP